MKFTRFPMAVLAGLLVSCAMFVGLYGLMQGGGHGVGAIEVLPTIDFVRIKRESELQTIERKKPEPPPPPKTPPPPKKLEVAADNVQNQVEPMDAPAMSLDARITGTAINGAIGSGGGGGGPISAAGLFDGDIIPMVKVQPTYPASAQRMGIEGKVVLQVTVNADGTVREVKVLESQPRGVFDAEARRAMMRWKFKPRVVDGVPQAQRGIQPLEFKLSGE